MADIVIYIGAVNPAPSGDDVLYSGSARCSGMSPSSEDITWSVSVAPNALAATVNDTIKDAAINAADVAGYVVGALDKKTVIGGAVGL